eukprot:6490419-Amphidinium_carterae.3
MTDWGSEFENTSLKIAPTNMGVSLTHSPRYQPKSNGTSARMVGIFKSGIRRLMLGANKPAPLPKWSWVYAARHVSVLLRHSVAELAYTGPAFGETVAIWSSQSQAAIKAMTPRGVVSRYLCLDAWTSKRCFVLDPDDPENVRTGLAPEPINVELCRRGFPCTYGSEHCPFATFTSPEGHDV